MRLQWNIIAMKIFVIFLAPTTSCTDSSERIKERTDDDDHFTVLVIDDGFDSSPEVFDGKIVAQYNLICKGSSEENDLALPFEELKKKALKGLSETDSTTCKLNRGNNSTLNPNLSKSSSLKESWNEAVLNKEIDIYRRDLTKSQNDLLDDILSGSNGKYATHGTQTSSVIAYNNPKVKIVTLQIELSTANEFERKKDCNTQDEIDNYVRLVRDPDYREAYINRPDSVIDKKLKQIVKEHNIKIANLSFSSPARVKLERKFEENGCGKVDLRSYFLEDNKLSQEKVAAEEKSVEVLAISSAGNDGIEVDSFQDTNQCSDQDNLTLIVGSYNYSSSRKDPAISDFSQYGKCVDAYAFGHRVITATPGGFLNVVSGTSFSAPMAIRYITQNFDPSLTPRKIMEEFLDSRDRRRFLPMESYPEELAFESSTSVDSFALSAPSNVQKVLKNRKVFRHLRQIFR